MNKVTLADLIIAFFDLLEAEGQALKQNSAEFLAQERHHLRQTAHQTSWGLAVMLTAAFIFLGAIGFFSWAIFLFLNQTLSTPVSALLTGTLLLTASILIALLARRCFLKPRATSVIPPTSDLE